MHAPHYILKVAGGDGGGGGELDVNGRDVNVEESLDAACGRHPVPGPCCGVCVPAAPVAGGGGVPERPEGRRRKKLGRGEASGPEGGERCGVPPPNDQERRGLPGCSRAAAAATRAASAARRSPPPARPTPATTLAARP